ncbi:MAG: 16S rRNA (cytosine(967)-C(5))-methyltransferase RsmB, partial [Ignavibacteriales bacterium]|nr:16S rRNA (cytosine(967)-C(5))-methyltransferase RsmB [Ignavibacteriales bacterium]
TEPEENFGVVQEFLAQHPEFLLEPAAAFVDASFVHPQGYVETLPHRHGIDGSFAVRLVKRA